MIKRIVILSILFSGVCLQPLSAQLYLGADGAYLGTIAINQNNYGFSEMDYAYKSGFQGGISAGYSFGLIHNVEVGFYYSSQGVNYASTFQSELHEKAVDLNYMHIPILYRLVSGDAAEGKTGTRFSFSFGPYIGLLLNSNIDWSVNEMSYSMASFHQSQNRNPNIAEIKAMLNADGEPDDYNDLFGNTDFGLTGSLGVRSYLSETLFLRLDLFGGFGFSDLNAEAWQFVNSQGEYKKTQNVFGGIRLGLGIWLTD
ncbi:MAG: PorT family protein [Bacteroidetes bacterium]|nr:PorT family protein [Bacteroidota bacterium]